MISYALRLGFVIAWYTSVAIVVAGTAYGVFVNGDGAESAVYALWGASIALILTLPLGFAIGLVVGIARAIVKARAKAAT